MFTPPPSPRRPPPDQDLNLPSESPAPDIKTSAIPVDSPPPSSSDLKHRMGRRTLWTVILVPVALVLITLSTHYIAHPFAFDLLSDSPSNSDWHAVADWSLHKPHSEPMLKHRQVSASIASSSGIVFPSAATTSSVASTAISAGSPPLPTIPSSPPVLPTPFPQPFDESLANNFSSPSCYAFFQNMTNTAPFRSCRPFSLLLQNSFQFINAQTNVTAANAMIWGTCNTTLSESQCTENMAWFATEMQTACSVELGTNNQMVTITLQGLQAYDLMRTTGCLADQSTEVYCYIEASNNSNPSDLYFYQLPLGTPIPPSTTPTCSACTKSLLALYAEALGNGSEAVTIGKGLKSTYSAAAELATSQCGANYAEQLTSDSGRSLVVSTTQRWWIRVLMLLMVWCSI